jgi:hypothetical protein
MTAARAIRGRLLGRDAEGAALGGGASTDVAASANDKDASIPAGERVTLRLQLQEVATVEVTSTGRADG